MSGGGGDSGAEDALNNNLLEFIKSGMFWKGFGFSSVGLFMQQKQKQGTQQKQQHTKNL